MMSELYPKINGLFKRDEKGKFIIGEWAQPEFGLLENIEWLWTEKVDGTNIRITFLLPENKEDGYELLDIIIGGRTNNAQIHADLISAIHKLVNKQKVYNWMVEHEITSATLYGEGYGAGIQQGGHYRQDKSFILFDVKISGFWLTRAQVVDIAATLGLDTVALMKSPLSLVWRMFEKSKGEPWFMSAWDGANPEGLVGRPAIDLYNRKGERITTKLKFKDFQCSH